MRAFRSGGQKAKPYSRVNIFRRRQVTFSEVARLICIGTGEPAMTQLKEAIMRNATAVSLAFAASVLLTGFGASAQTWVETHPTRIDGADRVPDRDAQAGKTAELRDAAYQQAQLPARTEDSSRTAPTKPDDSTFDHPENAATGLFRHE
jgi:hypothetical protein